MHKSSFANTFTFKIEPDEQGGATKTVSINRHNIAESPDPGRTKKKAADAHLLIGFDTEYQTNKDRENEYTVEHGAKNDLLSYQFSIKLFDKTIWAPIQKPKVLSFLRQTIVYQWRNL